MNLIGQKRDEKTIENNNKKLEEKEEQRWEL
jgi:hypothetical protein